MLQGTTEYEAERLPILAEISANIPEEWYLPQDLIDNAPKDVSNIPSTCGLLNAEELEITEAYDATGLAEALAARKYTAVTVVKAFIKRAAIAHQLVRCMSQFFPQAAIEQAARLDQHLLKTGKTVGPLHGVPVTIKEHMAIAGQTSSFGMLSLRFPDDKDCQMVDILRKAGAVFFCKTNQPQAIMHMECSSYYGRTLSPYNINLSPGGSSGGESSLIALKGSVIGIGSDIGGSIRAPAAFCGLYGWKPSTGLLPMLRMLRGAMPAELNVEASAGPLGRSLRDMDLINRVTVESKPWLEDPKMIPTTWTGLKTAVPRRLKVGILDNDGFVDPQPPIKRGMAWVRKLLSDPKYSDLIEVKDFQQYKAAEALDLIKRLFLPDSGLGIVAAVEATGEPILPLTQVLLPKGGKLGDVYDVNNLRFERDTFRTEYLEHWNAQDVDVVIGPGHVGTAQEHDKTRHWAYTTIWNLVDFPGLSFPTPLKSEKGEKYAPDYKPLSDDCRLVKEAWDEGDFEGAPVGLQINARKHHDNDLFGAMAVLKDILSLP